MKVAHVITRMIVGGAQENTLLNCQDLVEHHQDDVLLITGPALGPEGDLLQRTQRPVNFPVKVIPELRRAIHPWRDWRSLRAVRQAIREFRPEVVHTHSAKGGVLGRLAAHRERVPVIVHTVHGAPFYPYQSPLTRMFYRAAERFAAKRCHRLISVADAMTDLMVDADVAPRDKFQTIYSGMAVEPFVEASSFREQTRAKYGFRDDDIVVGKVARLVELKGHEFVVAAAERVIAGNSKVKFFWVGDGRLRGELEARIAALNLQDHFVFAGLVDPREIPALIGGMDLLVHASLREGLARALPQSLLAGIPAISFDIDGAREVVLDGQTGRLLPPKDVEGLAAAILQLSEDPALRQAMGKTGQSRCLDVFPHETMTRRIRELYCSLLERK